MQLTYLINVEAHLADTMILMLILLWGLTGTNLGRPVTWMIILKTILEVKHGTSSKRMQEEASIETRDKLLMRKCEKIERSAKNFEVYTA